MKKLLFVLAFTFISSQAMPQMYILSVGYNTQPIVPCPTMGDISLLIVDPAGNETIACISGFVKTGLMGELNQEINNILNLGYKLIATHYGPSTDFFSSTSAGGGPSLLFYDSMDEGYTLRLGTTFLFAIP